MRAPFAVRYFLAVSPPAAPLLAVLAILPIAAAVLEAIDAGSSDWVLASIGLVQLFAASTGFTRHASRGYYDPVLLSRGRGCVALAHLVASTAPGLLSWIACGVAQAIAARTLTIPAFRVAGWAGILLVSAIPWAVSARSVPYLGGTLWVILSASLLVSGRLLVPFGQLQARSGWAGEHPALAFGTGMAFPLVVPSLEWPEPTLAAFLTCAALSAGGGIAAIARADVPLSETGV